jgi:hypothetical protein
MGWAAIHHACNSPAAIEAVLQLGGDIHAEVGLGRIIASHGRSSTSYTICKDIRCLCF